MVGHSSRRVILKPGRQIRADHNAKRSCRRRSGVEDIPAPDLASTRVSHGRVGGMTTTLCPSLPQTACGPIKHKDACGKVATSQVASFPEAALLLARLSIPSGTHHSNDSEIGTRCATKLVAGALPPSAPVGDRLRAPLIITQDASRQGRAVWPRPEKTIEHFMPHKLCLCFKATFN